LIKFLLNISILLFTLHSFSQQKVIDSLQKLLTNNISQEQRIIIHLKLYEQSKNNNSDTSFNHLQSAEKLIGRKTNDTIKVKVLILQADYYLYQPEYDSVFYFVNKGLSLTKNKMPKKLIDLYTIKGLAYHYKGNYNKAIEAHLEAAKIGDSIKFNAGKAKIFNNIGIAYIEMQNWVKAEEYMNKSLKICRALDIKRGMVYLLGNLGIIYKNQFKYDKAIEMYLESNLIGETINDQRAISRNYDNLGSLYEEQENYNEALKYYQKSLKTSKELEDKQTIAVSLHNIGSVYTKQRNFDAARSSFEQSLSIANAIGSLNNIKETHYGLAEMYETQGKYQQSIIERKNYEKWKDSIINTEHLSAISELEVKYKTEIKDKEIIQKQLKLDRKQKLNVFLTSLSITLLITSIVLWFGFTQRQKRKNQEILTLKREHQIKTLESLIEGEEKERLRIAKELHDGVNGDLSALKYKLISLSDTNNKVINEAIKMLDRSCEQVRAISHNLIPPSLEDFELVEALENYCHKMNDIHKVLLTFQHLGNKFALPKKEEINIFRIIQELVSNSIKHADASEINVQLSNRNKSLQVTVDDNGKGFDRNKLDTHDGIGMSNIQSRVDYLNANVDFSSGPRGTSFIIEIDLDKSHDN